MHTRAVRVCRLRAALCALWRPHLTGRSTLVTSSCLSGMSVKSMKS